MHTRILVPQGSLLSLQPPGEHICNGARKKGANVVLHTRASRQREALKLPSIGMHAANMISQCIYSRTATGRFLLSTFRPLVQCT